MDCHGSKAKKAAKSENEVTFEFCGKIGAVINYASGHIDEVFPDSQAERLGVQKGWQVISVDNEPYTRRLWPEHWFWATRHRLEEKEPTFKITFSKAPGGTKTSPHQEPASPTLLQAAKHNENVDVAPAADSPLTTGLKTDTVDERILPAAEIAPAVAETKGSKDPEAVDRIIEKINPEAQIVDLEAPYKLSWHEHVQRSGQYDATSEEAVRAKAPWKIVICVCAILAVSILLQAAYLG